MKSEVEEPLIDYTPNPNKLGNDLENDFNYGNNVLSSSAEVRKGFLRKVYGILACVQTHIIYNTPLMYTKIRKSVYFKM
jgi:hypothetical protein